MAYAAKLVNVVGVLCKEESTYGTAIAVAGAADTIQPWYTDRGGLPVNLGYLYDGDLGGAPGNLGEIRHGVPYGGAMTCELPFFFKGGGAAYSASVVPSLHKQWKASGFTAAVVVTGGAETWTYTPTLDSVIPTSLTTEFYTDDEKYPSWGGLLNWKFSGDTTGYIRHTFSWNAIKGTVASSASSVAAGFTYPLAAVVPTTAVGSTVTLGLYTPAIGVKSVDFDLGRTLNPRAGLDAADGHLGFTAQGRKPRLTVTVEKTAMITTPFNSSAGLDAIELWESGINFACSFQHAGAQYFKWKLNMPQAMLVAPPERVNMNGVACWKLVVGPYNTTPAAQDDLTVLCD